MESGIDSEAYGGIPYRKTRLTNDEILTRILGEHATLHDVVTAFTGQHPTIPAYAWSAIAELKGEVVTVAGRIFEGDSEIGRFSRRLVYVKGVGQAIHEIMEIARAHRDNDIAKHHYARALEFYERAGIRYIWLDAEGEGPVVWPTFGFDFTKRRHRDMLIKILRDWEVNPLPDPASLLAPKVVDIHTDESPELGEEAIYELANRAGEPLPMCLDLHNDLQRTYLRNRGII